jgi:hypothetical protein
VEKEPMSFAKDILPLFRSVDIDHMSSMDVLLNNYIFMSDPKNAQAVYEYLDGTRQPQMPPNGPYWSAHDLSKYKAWMDDGRRP